GAEEEINSVAWTALLMMSAFAGIAAIALAGIARWLVEAYFRVPVRLITEAIGAFYWIALSIPFVVLTAGLRGMLQAKQRFAMLSIIGIFAGVFSFVAPLAVLPFSESLSHVVALLVVGKLFV